MMNAQQQQQLNNIIKLNLSKQEAFEQVMPIEFENLLIYNYLTLNLHNYQMLTIDLQACQEYVEKVQSQIYHSYNSMVGNLLESIESFVTELQDAI